MFYLDTEVPVQLLLAFKTSPSAVPVDASEQPHLEAKAKADIFNNLTVLEEQLSDKTFIVGESVTLADISLFAAYMTILKLGAVAASSFPALHRWFMTVAMLSKVKEIVGDCTVLAGCSDPAGGSMECIGVAGASTGGKWDRRRTRVKELLQASDTAIGKQVVLKGWVRTIRAAEKGATLFVELTDGSTVRGVQLVITTAGTEGATAVADCGGVGASLSATGHVVASPAKGQTIEVHVKQVTVLGAVYGGEGGTVGGKHYPMSKKQHTEKFLREKAHLRPRSKVFSAAMRIRHAMAFATHKFFNDRGFVYVHTPLITAADCEGAGEQFTVSTLLNDGTKTADIPTDPASGCVDYSKDFFGRRCCMTVSGQLNVETHACAMSDVYTFGPTFRAENSHTSRHLAEFWMIEPEICFADLADDLALAVSAIFSL